MKLAGMPVVLAGAGSVVLLDEALHVLRDALVGQMRRLGERVDACWRQCRSAEASI